MLAPIDETVASAAIAQSPAVGVATPAAESPEPSMTREYA
jgi:hypothetical protein